MLQSNIQEKKTATKEQLVIFLDDQKSSCLDVQNELDALGTEIEKQKQSRETEIEQQEREDAKMAKYKQIMEQAGAKLKANEKKIAQLQEQLHGKQEQQVNLQEEVDRVKRADKDFFGSFSSKEVQLTVEVEVSTAPGSSVVAAATSLTKAVEPENEKGTAAIQTGASEGAKDLKKSESTANPRTEKEIWCMLRENNGGKESESEKGNRRRRRWWKKGQLVELMSASTSSGAGESLSSTNSPSESSRSAATNVLPSVLNVETRIPPPMQTLIRQATSVREEEAAVVRRLKDERSRFLANVAEEYEKYKRKAATVVKIQAEQASGPMEAKALAQTIAQTMEKNQSLRQEVNNLALEIQKVQQSNAGVDSKITQARSDILLLSDGLTQKQSQFASFEKKKADLEIELQEKVEEARIAEKYWRDEERGRKHAMEQEVEILKTLAKNLEIEIKTLKDRYATMDRRGSHASGGIASNGTPLTTPQNALAPSIDLCTAAGECSGEGSGGASENSPQKNASSSMATSTAAVNDDNSWSQNNNNSKEESTTGESKSSVQNSSGSVSQDEEQRKKSHQRSGRASCGAQPLELPRSTSPVEDSVIANVTPTNRSADARKNPMNNRLKLNLKGIGSSEIDLRDDGDAERKPTVPWSDIMELRALIRQYEQCTEQEKRDEELLRQQNEHLILQLQVVSSNSIQSNSIELCYYDHVR